MNADQALKGSSRPRKKDKLLSYDESVDEDAKLIDAEPVEVEGRFQRRKRPSRALRKTTSRLHRHSRSDH